MQPQRRFLKASSYYWEFLKRFGLESYLSWKREVLAALLVNLIAFGLTWRQKGAWDVTLVALEANFILLAVIVGIHFVRTPYLLHGERLHPELGGERTVHAAFGFFGCLVVVVLLAAGGYAVLRPWVLRSPSLTIAAPGAPSISQEPNAPVASVPRKHKASPGGAVSAQPSARVQPIPANQPTPPTPLEQIIQVDRNLTPGDRDRLSNALYDYAQVLDDGMAVQLQSIREFQKVTADRVNGSLADNATDHSKALRALSPSIGTFAKEFGQAREKWKYYPNQTNYIFGDNPDNLGWSALINATEGLARFLDNWSKITNRRQREVLDLVSNQQVYYQQFLTGFYYWDEGCQQRLAQVKQSIQPDGAAEPMPDRRTVPAPTALF